MKQTISCAVFTLTAAMFLVSPASALPTVNDVEIELYHVFPVDSDTTRTPNVATRVNSPSDNNFAAADGILGGLTFTTTVLNPNFTAANSVFNNINPAPNQFTGGQGPMTGAEVQFNVHFNTPFSLAAGDQCSSVLRSISAMRLISSGFRHPSRRHHHSSSATCKAGPAMTGLARWRPIGRGSAQTSPIKARSTPLSR
jgi:hypothetical protein